MRRFLCLHFPNWPVQWLRHIHPETHGHAVALYERLAHGLSLGWCSHEARDLGAHPGMSVADVRVLAPELLLYEADHFASRQMLEDVCLWAGRFSPLAGVEPTCAGGAGMASQPESLLLDITSCEQVFRGEQNLLMQAVAGLRKKGFAANAAIAPTLSAAWALAHYGAHEQIKIVTGDPLPLLQALQPLPVSALRLESHALAHLHSLGIECVGELIKQPRATLPSRFGAALIERIDQALGDAPELLTPLRPAPEFHAARAFDYPLRSSELLFNIVEQLTVQLARGLQAAERGAREIECWLYHELAQPVCVAARLFKGSASGKHLWKLLRVKLEDSFRKPHAVMLREQRASSKHGSHIVIDAEEGVCAVALQVLSSEKMGSGQLPLFDAGADADHDVSESLASLLDRLASRLGADAVFKISPGENAIPERAYKGTSFQTSIPSEKARNLPALLERPLRLLQSPVSISMEWSERMSLRGKQIVLRKITRPERIESGWWSEFPAHRDYYIAESESGARYWLFQRLEDAQWFLHGTFE